MTEPACRQRAPLAGKRCRLPANGGPPPANGGPQRGRAIEFCEIYEISEYAASADLARRQQLFPGADRLAKPPPPRRRR